MRWADSSRSSCSGVIFSRLLFSWMVELMIEVLVGRLDAV